MARTDRMSPDAVRLVAPAKLTVSLRIMGVSHDGYHLLEAEMVSLDLADELWIGSPTQPGRTSVEIQASAGSRAGGLPVDGENLVARALEAVGRHAQVRLLKCIPVGGGLGGGSADAAAVLRWAGCHDPAVAARVGADVPFCVSGGRAMVRGIGEAVSPLPYQLRSYVLLVPPFGVDTAAAYRAWDQLTPEAAHPSGPNELVNAALVVEPRLADWRDALAQITGTAPVLAGSGSTWFVEGEPALYGIEDRRTLRCGGEEGLLLAVQTVPPVGDTVQTVPPVGDTVRTVPPVGPPSSRSAE